MLWDTLFYQKLDSSINLYINEIIKNNNEINNKINKSNNNKNNNGLENINAIKEQLMNIKYITEIKEDVINSKIEFYKQNWYSKLSKRDFVFYDLIYELFHFMNTYKNKLININNNNNQFNYFSNNQNNENINNFIGINSLLNAIYFDLLIKDVKNYPKQIKEIIPQFYSDVSIINNFISIMFLTTNVYDTLSIFSLLDILDYILNKQFDYIDYNQDYIKDSIDYSLFKKSFFIIINSDNSLAIAKYIWLYYKNISLFGYIHIKDIITSILTTFFFNLFFHWSFQVREIFYYFLIFILGYKIKKQIKRKKIENDDINNQIITHHHIKANFTKKMRFNLFASMDEEYIKNKSKNINEFFYVEDYLTENMEIINKLQKIVEKEKFDLTYMDKMEQIRDKDILDKIPEEPHGNIIECIKQYNTDITKFNIWKKNIEDNHISEDKIEYPKMEISIIKDDTIQY
jgi:hypothetical protein